MTDKEILEKVIKKVGDNPDIIDIFDDSTFNTDGNNLRMDLVRGYVFSHRFARAFFGTNYWALRLPEMVFFENPLEYLAKFLD